MRRWIVAVLVMALAPVGLSLTSTAGSSGALGRYIVVLKDAGTADAVAGSVSGLGATVNSLFGSVNSLVVSLPILNVGRLERDPRVAFVTPDRPVRLLDTTGAASAVPTGVMRIGAAPM